MDNIIAYYVGNQPFRFYIEKANAVDTTDGEMIIEGIASSVSVDHDQERMTLPALVGMARIINTETVPLRIEHQKEDDAIIGTVYEGNVDERGRLHIKAKLDPKHPISKFLYNALKSGTKLGLSVGGEVVRAVRELNESLGKVIRSFYDVKLNEISVTPSPSNFEAWLINKSIIKDKSEANELYNTPIYDRFLFDNQHLDYLAVIEKSIPPNKWQKVDDKNKDIVMKLFNKETTIETTGETKITAPASDTTVEEVNDVTTVTVKPEQSVPTENDTLKRYVDKQISDLRKDIVELLKDLKKSITPFSDTGTALDQVQPTQEKVESPSTESVISDYGTEVSATEKQREGQEDTYGVGDTSTPRETGEVTESETVPALDQTNENVPKLDVSRLKSVKVNKQVVTGTDASVTTTHDITQQTERETGEVTESEYTPALEQTNPDVVMSDTSTLKAIKKSAVQLGFLVKELQKLANNYEKEADSTSLSTRVAEIAETLAEVGSTLSELGSYATTDASIESDNKDLSETISETESKEETNTYGEEYRIGSEMKLAARRVSDLIKLRKNKKGSNLDLFVAYVSDVVQKMQEKLEKQGKTIIGLEAKIADIIRSDETIQKSIQEWMKEPGPKKSVVFGIPYMISKDGKRYPLSDGINLSGDIKKSDSGKPKSFKELYQENYSSVARGEIV